MTAAVSSVPYSGGRDEPEARAHKAVEAALDYAFERGRLTGLRDARDHPDDVDKLIEDCQRWL